MASIKVKFRPSVIVGKEGTIYYQIIHERKVCQLSTSYKVLPSQWDKLYSMLIVPSLLNAESESEFNRLCGCIKMELARLTRIVCKFDKRGVNYTAADVVHEFESGSAEYSLVQYMNSVIISLRQCCKWRTAETYVAALNSFLRFLASMSGGGGAGRANDIMLDNMTPDIIEAYEAFLIGRGNTSNTTSFYMRILRAVYNRAVADGIIDNCNPFRRVYTGIGKTVKRALPQKMLKKIKAMDLSRHPLVDYARDMFMLSFFLRGMSFVDMSFLKKSDLSHGYLSYRRRKTGQLLSIAWTKEMQVILDKYPENPTHYLLPIITKTGINERIAYKNKAYNINNHLKKIASMLGVHMPLTLYCARHSWASMARSKGIPVSVISEGMGHSSEATTRIYLASLDTSVIDKANALIISSL